MSTKKQKQSSNYIVQGGILAGASILVRIIGLLYRLRTGKDQPAQDAAGNEIIEFDLADDAGAPAAAPAGDAPQPAPEPAPDGDIVEFATFDAAAQPGPAGAAEEEQHE